MGTRVIHIFENHLEYLRRAAIERGISFSEMLEIVAGTPEHPAVLSKSFSDPTKRTMFRIAPYQPQLDEWLASESLNKTQAVTEALKAAEQQKAALAGGRIEGVKIRQKKAAEKQAELVKAIADLFDEPGKPGWGWSNLKITDFLKQHNFGYADSTILHAVKRVAANFRRVRKEQLASEYPTR